MAKNYYDAELLTCVFESDCIAADNPPAVDGCISDNCSVIAGASLGLAGTPDKLPEVYVVSAAGSDATDLIVITVADPTDASNLADISNVSEV